MSGYQNVQARFGGPTSRSSRLPRCSGSKLHLQLLSLSTLLVSGPLMVVAVEHLLPTRAVPYWFRVSAPSTDPSGKSLSTSNEVRSAKVDQAMFSSEINAPAPKGMTASTGAAIRNSQLWCTVLTFPASSFTSYAGTLSATWQTTTYSVSLHWSWTFCFPWYTSFFISTTSPSTNCAVLVARS